MLISSGEKVHIVERRMFEGDVRRHFLGTVEGATELAIRVAGHSFVWDPGSTSYERRTDQRIRVIPLTGTAVVVNVLPPAADLGAARYELDRANHLVLTDGEHFSLDINEFGANR